MIDCMQNMGVVCDNPTVAFAATPNRQNPKLAG